MAHGAPVPRIHDLVRLSDLCASIGIRLAVSDADLDLLTGHAVEARYPGGILTLADAQQAVAIARTVRQAVRRALGLR